MVAYVHIEYSTHQFSEESKGGGPCGTEKSVVLRGLKCKNYIYFWLRKLYSNVEGLMSKSGLSFKHCAASEEKTNDSFFFSNLAYRLIDLKHQVEKDVYGNINQAIATRKYLQKSYSFQQSITLIWWWTTAPTWGTAPSHTARKVFINMAICIFFKIQPSYRFQIIAVDAQSNNQSVAVRRLLHKQKRMILLLLK